MFTLDPNFRTLNVLIVDDQSTSRNILGLLTSQLAPNIQTTEMANPQEALGWATQYQADLILVDYMMPEMDGIMFTKMIRTLEHYENVPIVMITVMKEPEKRNEALEAGVTDFMSKPIDMQECQARCRNLLTMRQQHLKLMEQKESLEEAMHQTIAEIKVREHHKLKLLAKLTTYKSNDTTSSLARIGLYSRLIAETAGLTGEELEIIELAAQLHGVGKIALPDRLTQPQVALSDEDKITLAQHTVIGHDLLSGSTSKYLQKGAEIALNHHERYDGKGYPRALTGRQIPLSARIVPIAYTFYTLTSPRADRPAYKVAEALALIQQNAGTQFDPDLVKQLCSIRPRLEKIHETPI